MDEVNTPVQAGGESLGVSEGADAIAAILNPPAKPDKEEVKAEQPERDAATDQAPDDGDVGDETPEQPETDAPEENQGEEPKFRLADGTEVTQAEIDEWRKGNLRQSDYTRKTQELATTRKELETRQAEYTQKAQTFEQTVNFAIELAYAHLPQKPDPEMVHTDPLGYMQQKEDYEVRIGHLQQLQAAKQGYEQEQVALRQQAMTERLTNERDALVNAMPELKDPAKLTSFSTELSTAIERYGFNAQDLVKVDDHRIFLLAKDAMAYQKLMAAKPKALDKAKDAPPVQRPGNRASPAAAQARATKDKMDRLRQTGSLRDGADVILDLIKG